MDALAPIYTAGLFEPLSAELVALLRGLDASDWTRPTVAGSWLVRDVAGHLLDGDLRKLAGGRDGYRSTPGRALDTFADIVGFIDEINASGVAYAARLGPRLTTDLLEVTGRWVAEFVSALAPHDEAHISVAWAGELRSENWMDTGREYTERWHHQMQIRDAVGAPPLLLDERWLSPLLDLSVRALPRAYENVVAPAGTAVVFEVEPYVWSVVRGETGWRVFGGEASDALARVRAGADTAWRLLYNALAPDDARARVTIDGDPRLAGPILGARSVMVV